jgi:predicted secreted protein
MITESDIDKVSTVKLNDLIDIKLEAQFSTGFSWEIQSMKGFESIGKPKVIPSEKGIPGGKEHQLFIVKAKETGDGEITLIYAQPWKKDDKPLKTVSLKFTVK